MNIALISDDFPTPDYGMIAVNRTCMGNGNKPYLADDKDPEPIIC